jgi:hypothetical protein
MKVAFTAARIRTRAAAFVRQPDQGDFGTTLAKRNELFLPEKVAGVAGFEPPYGGIKTLDMVQHHQQVQTSCHSPFLRLKAGRLPGWGANQYLSGFSASAGLTL